MNRKNSSKRGIGFTMVAFLLLAVFLGALLFKKHERATAPPVSAPAQQLHGTVNVTLFFASLAGDGLVREGREIGPCDGIEACLEEILEELINGPLGELAPVLPLTGMFNSVKLDMATAHVDFARELLDGLPAGSNSELYAVYSVVNSICFNYPQVKQVLFTVDGKPLATLQGHIDISAAVAPDFTLEMGAPKPKKVKNNEN